MVFAEGHPYCVLQVVAMEELDWEIGPYCLGMAAPDVIVLEMGQ